MLILAVSLVFALSACGECEHEQTETKTEVTFEGDCVVPQRYDEVVYCLECDEEISRKSYNGKCADHDPKDPVPENVDMLDCTVGGVADMVVYCNNSRCNAVISRTEGVEIKKATAHTLETKLIFDEKHTKAEILEYCTGCAYRHTRALTADEKTQYKADIDAAKACATTHSYKANACVYCKRIDTTSLRLVDKLEFKLNSDKKSYTLVGLKDRKDSVVPTNLRIGYYQGPNDKQPLPITNIAADAFKNVSGIKYVSIGSCVKEIGADAFAGCNFTNLIIYDLDAWGQIKFANAGANPLGSSQTLSIYEDIKVGAHSTFSTAEIERITGTYTFAGLKASTVYIAADTIIVGEGAFANCDALTYVHIDGTSNKTIRKDAFLGCESIRVAYNNSSNTSYASATANPCYYADAYVVNGEKLNGSVLVIKDGTTKINSYAYAGLDITAVKIPASVTQIADGAFAGCTKLTSVEFLGNNASLTIGKSAFNGCSAIKSIALPANTGAIGDYAFNGCVALSSITLSDNVTAIGEGAFKGCVALTAITLPKDLITVAPETFAECSALKTVKFGANLEVISDSAFLNCTSIITIEFTNKIVAVGDSAFAGCTSLTYLAFDEALKTIGEFAFENCAKLTRVAVPPRAESIGLGAFKGCASLEYIKLPFIGNSSNTHFGYIFGATVYEENRTAVPTSLKEVRITGSVSAIADSAFRGCEGIVTITLPAVTSVGNYAFDGCTGLREVRFPSLAAWLKVDFGNYSANPVAYSGALYVEKTVEGKTVYVLVDTLTVEGVNVKPFAFYGATTLKSVEIKGGVTSIGNDAFYGCNNVSVVKISSDVEKIGARAFFSCDAIKAVYIDTIESWCNIAFADMFANPLYYIDFVELVDKDTEPEVIYVGGDCCTQVIEIYNDSDLEAKRVAFTNIVIPASVKTIGAYAFAGCDIITEIVFEGDLEAIGSFAFYGCNKLTYVEIPDTCKVIGNSAFEGCVALAEISLGGVETIGDRAFAGCVAVKELVIPNTTLTIGKEAFSGCVLLNKLTLGSKLNTIGTSAFYGCTELKSVTLPASVEKVSAHAFCSCNGGLNIVADGTWKINGKDVAAKDLITYIDFEWVRA